jgi:hypothetical protein
MEFATILETLARLRDRHRIHAMVWMGEGGSQSRKWDDLFSRTQ